MDWDNPLERAELVEQIGVEAYNKAFEEYIDSTTIAIIGGHKIRPIKTRFGRLFNVGNTGKAFDNLEAAESFATENPQNKTRS